MAPNPLRAGNTNNTRVDNGPLFAIWFLLLLSSSRKTNDYSPLTEIGGEDAHILVDGLFGINWNAFLLEDVPGRQAVQSSTDWFKHRSWIKSRSSTAGCYWRVWYGASSILYSGCLFRTYAGWLVGVVEWRGGLLPVSIVLPHHYHLKTTAQLLAWLSLRTVLRWGRDGAPGQRSCAGVHTTKIYRRIYL